MAFNFSFVKLPKHRVFNYQPRYYDERKEKMAERYAEKDRAMGIVNEEKYVSGKNIRGKMRSISTNTRKQAMNKSVSRIINILSLLAMMVALYILAQNFTHLFR